MIGVPALYKLALIGGTRTVAKTLLRRDQLKRIIVSETSSYQNIHGWMRHERSMPAKTQLSRSSAASGDWRLQVAKYTFPVTQ